MFYGLEDDKACGFIPIEHIDHEIVERNRIVLHSLWYILLFIFIYYLFEILFSNSKFILTWIEIIDWLWIITRIMRYLKTCLVIWCLRRVKKMSLHIKEEEWYRKVAFYEELKVQSYHSSPPSSNASQFCQPLGKVIKKFC